MQLETLSIFESYYKQIGFVKERKRFVAACNQINWKIGDPRNGKECYQSFTIKKNILRINYLKL